MFDTTNDAAPQAAAPVATTLLAALMPLALALLAGATAPGTAEAQAAMAAATGPSTSATAGTKATPTPARRADPLDASAAVPPLRYRSALNGYQPNNDPPARGWREANDDTARAGGWRAYAREASTPEPAGAASDRTAPAPARPSAPAPADGGHDTHHRAPAKR